MAFKTFVHLKKLIKIKDRRLLVHPYLLTGIIVGFAAVSFAVSLVATHVSASDTPASVAGGGAEEVSDLLDRISQHIIIPQDEAPSVATILDLEAVQQQQPALFKNAEQGDKLVIWSRQAVVYSPTKDIVVAAVTLLDAPSSTQSE